jgi:inositol oxygenase
MKNVRLQTEPLSSLDDWDDFVSKRLYPCPDRAADDGYRDYDDPAREGIREFYRLNHRHQTYDFVRLKKAAFGGLDRARMSVFEALAFLDRLVDDSDPDIELSQLQHLLQTSEAIRRDGHEEWFVLTGLLHDLGKVLCLFDEPQWAVVGDTFPVGCAFSDKIVYREYFAANPDTAEPRYQSRLGVYEEGCGLRNVDLSWGHDEYLYQVLEDRLPQPALYMIRYHSFYAWHREGEYDWLCDDHDRSMLPWVQRFNAYDLYSKSPLPPVWSELQPYYADLVNRHLSTQLLF